MFSNYVSVYNFDLIRYHDKNYIDAHNTYFKRKYLHLFLFKVDHYFNMERSICILYFIKNIILAGNLITFNLLQRAICMTTYRFFSMEGRTRPTRSINVPLRYMDSIRTEEDEFLHSLPRVPTPPLLQNSNLRQIIIRDRHIYWYINFA